jgi:hypothetical protein
LSTDNVTLTVIGDNVKVKDAGLDSVQMKDEGVGLFNLDDGGASDGQVMKWNTSLDKWVPGTDNELSGSAFVGGALMVGGPIDRINQMFSFDPDGIQSRSVSSDSTDYFHAIIPATHLGSSTTDDTFCLMHSGFYYSASPVDINGDGNPDNPRLWLYGNALPDGGGSNLEDPMIYAMHDSFNFRDEWWKRDRWYALKDTSGTDITNPVMTRAAMDTLIDTTYALTHDIFDTCECVFQSDFFMADGVDDIPTLIGRASLTCSANGELTWRPVNTIWAHKFNGKDFRESYLLVDGYFSSGGCISRTHNTMELLAPSGWLYEGGVRLICNSIPEDSSAKYYPHLFSGSSWEVELGADSVGSYFQMGQTAGCEEDDRMDVSWLYGFRLPVTAYYPWHPTFGQKSSGLYYSFSSRKSPFDSVYFGWSRNLVDWEFKSRPVWSSNLGFLDGALYTARPFEVKHPNFDFLGVVISGKDGSLWKSTYTEFYWEQHYKPYRFSDQPQTIDITDSVRSYNHAYLKDTTWLLFTDCDGATEYHTAKLEYAFPEAAHVDSTIIWYRATDQIDTIEQFVTVYDSTGLSGGFSADSSYSETSTGWSTSTGTNRIALPLDRDFKPGQKIKLTFDCDFTTANDSLWILDVWAWGHEKK